MQNPRVSVILTSRNGSGTIRRAIESVQRQMFTDWELVLFDDGSAEALAPVVSNDLRIHPMRSASSLGRQGALNAACAMAKGEYLAIIDDDDEWTDTTKLSQQVAFLDSHPDVGVVGTWANVVAENGDQIATLCPAIDDVGIRQRILGVNQFINSSTLFRRKIFEEVGGYERAVKLPANEDFDLWLRIGQRSKFANLPAVMVAWQKSSRSYSAGKQRTQSAAQLRLIAKYGAAYPLVSRIKAYWLTGLRYIWYTTCGAK